MKDEIGVRCQKYETIRNAYKILIEEPDSKDLWKKVQILWWC